MQTFILACSIVPIVVFAVIAWRESRKTDTLTKFFMYGEEIRKSSFFATLSASNTSLGAVIVVFVLLGYLYGMGILPWAWGFWITTMFASWWCIKNIHGKYRGKGEYVTLHEYLGYHFQSQKIRSTAAAISVIAYFGLFACEFVVGYRIFSVVFRESQVDFGINTAAFLTIWAVISVVAFYTSAAGFRAVLKTDVFQFLSILAMIAAVCAALFLFFSPLFSAKDYAEVFKPLSTWDAWLNPDGSGRLEFLLMFVFTNILFWGGWWPAAMDQWQRYAATKSNDDVAFNKKYGTMGWVTAIYFLLLTTTFLAVGAAVRIVVSPDGLNGFPIAAFVQTLLFDSGGLGLFLAGVIFFGLFASMFSTLDTYAIVSAQSVFLDIKLASDSNKGISDADKDESIKNKTLLQSRKLIGLIPIAVVPVFFIVEVFSDPVVFVYGMFAVMFALIPSIGFVAFGIKGDERVASWSVGVAAFFALVATILIAINVENHYTDKFIAVLPLDLLNSYLALYILTPATALVALCVYGIGRLSSRFLGEN